MATVAAAADDPLCREPVISVEFEVFGKVQGVYFPKYVRDICLQLGICGWVKNSKTGTIRGKMQGLRALVDQIPAYTSRRLKNRDFGLSRPPRALLAILDNRVIKIQWLTSVGSPDSEIHHCEFTNWETITKKQYQGFAIRF